MDTCKKIVTHKKTTASQIKYSTEMCEIQGRNKEKRNMAKTKGRKADSFFALALTILFFLMTGTFINENQGSLRAYSEMPAAKTGDMLIAGGIPFGVKLHTDGVLVVNVCDVRSSTAGKRPAMDAGIKKGDMIVLINGEKIQSGAQVCRLCEESGGEPMKITVMRAGKSKTLTVAPVKNADGEYKLGMWIKDSAAGIGTVTFVDPQTYMFGGLGHGICESSSGGLLPISYGTVEDVVLSGINIGKAGVPGELKGYFTGEKTGKLIKNTSSGVYGAYSAVPQEIKDSLYPVGSRNDVHEGKAYVICTIDTSGRKSYEIEISAINSSADSKNFTVTVTDESLIAATGGIVQGMSGSPIIQDGKLVGAVTHVLIGDPKSGYGIFIENMLADLYSAAGMAA